MYIDINIYSHTILAIICSKNTVPFVLSIFMAQILRGFVPKSALYHHLLYIYFFILDFILEEYFIYTFHLSLVSTLTMKYLLVWLNAFHSKICSLLVTRPTLCLFSISFIVQHFSSNVSYDPLKMCFC